MTYEGMLAETVAISGHNGDVGEAYYARPVGPGPFPGVVLIHHLPGWDEWCKEQTRKLAHHGFAAIDPHLYFREGPGSPDDVGARVRAGRRDLLDPGAVGGHQDGPTARGQRGLHTRQSQVVECAQAAGQPLQDQRIRFGSGKPGCHVAGQSGCDRAC